MIFLLLAAAIWLAPLLEAPGLRVHYGPLDAPAAHRAAEVMGALESRISTDLGIGPPEPLDVYLAQNDAAFDRKVEELSGTRPPRWALAVAIPGAKAVVIRAGRLEILSWNDLEPTLAHELTHLALGRMGPIPRWLNEGLAMWVSGRRLSPEERTALERLARNGELPPLEELDRNFPPHAEQAELAYLESLGFVQSLEAAAGRPAIVRLLQFVEDGTPFDRAFEKAFDAPLRGYEITWRADLAHHYSLLRDLAERISVFTIMGVLVLVAFVRYLFRRRRLLREMGEGEPPSPLEPEAS